MNESQIEITEREKSLLNIIPGATAIINGDGEIESVNRAWRESGGSQLFGENIISGNYFKFCESAVSEGSDYALKIIIGLREVLDGRRKGYSFKYPVHKKNRVSWFEISISPSSENVAIICFKNVTKHVTDENILRDSEERYRQQFNNSLSGIILGTLDGKITSVNNAACTILGYTREELLEGGRTLILDENHPLSVKASKEREEKSYFEGEKIYIHKSGKPIYVQISSVLYRNMDGEMVAMNTFKDITEKKEIKKKLEDEMRFTKTAMESVPGTFYVIDEKGEYVRWNAAFLNDLGYTDEMLKKMSPLDFIAEEDRDKVKAEIGKIFEGGSSSVIAKVITNGKGEKYYKMNGTRFETDEGLYIVGSGVDVTNLVMAESEKEKNYRMQKQLFENSPLGIVMIGADGKIKDANHGFEEMFGYNSSELINKKVNSLITDNDGLAKAEEISKSAFKGKSSQFEGVRYRKTGEKVPVLINAVPVKNNGEVIAVYGIYVDLTEQKSMEQKVKEHFESEKEARGKLEVSLNEKNILLQEVHHRVKNNLAVIAGLLELQMMEEESGSVISKLAQVQSRIFSIAQIHETLYKEKNILTIRFQEYLKSFVETLPQFGETGRKLTLKLDELCLNLNQAVPCGLILNEMFNVILPPNSDNDQNVTLSLDVNDNLVSLSIQGDSLDINNIIKNRNSERFQFKMIEILLDQLNAELDLDNDEKRATVSFQKANIRGSSSSFIEKEMEIS